MRVHVSVCVCVYGLLWRVVKVKGQTSHAVYYSVGIPYIILQPNEAVGLPLPLICDSVCSVEEKRCTNRMWAERRNCLMRSLSLCSAWKLFSQSLSLISYIHTYTHTCVSTTCPWLPYWIKPAADYSLSMHLTGCLFQPFSRLLSNYHSLLSLLCIICVHSLSPDRKVPVH